MLFTSASFLGFVLVLLIIYYGPARKAQWQTILVANFIFYGICGLSYLPYIIFSILTTYFCTNAMQRMSDSTKEYLSLHKDSMDRAERKAYKAGRQKGLSRILLLDILLNIGMLSVVKYTNFTISNINALLLLLGQEKAIDFLTIALPMGISFYVFMSVGYAIDVYRGKTEAETNVCKLACFISFFPQLVQGPISRYSDLSESLFVRHEFSLARMKSGFTRILWGFFKKLVIADRIVLAVNEIIHNPETYQGAFVLLGMLFYAIELYADFTGGIDITIGVAELLGVKVQENFIRPYFSKSIKEYWNRWHITMGSWFTDYIFYPISVSGWMRKLTHNSRNKLGDKIGKRVPVYLSAFIVWFATGIWHGASWNFIVWGLMNFVVIMISQELTPFYRWFHSRFHVEGSVGWKAFQVLRTILLMSSLRCFDCYRDVPLTFHMYGTIFTSWNLKTCLLSLGSLGLTTGDYLVVLLGTALIFLVSMASRQVSFREKLFAKGYWTQFAAIFGLTVIVLVFGVYGVGYDSSQFIYNQF